MTPTKEFTKDELVLVNIVLQVTSDQRPRSFGIHELKTAMSISDKLLASTEVAKDENGQDKKDADGNDIKVFVDATIDFTSDEIVLIKKLLNEGQWPVYQAKPLFSILEKLV